MAPNSKSPQTSAQTPPKTDSARRTEEAPPSPRARTRAALQPPAVHLRLPMVNAAQDHFAPTDPKVDLLRVPIIGRPLNAAVHSRVFQFLLILPNQVIFWVVIATGLLGGIFAKPSTNFSTVITWYIWFCVVFILIVGVGRGWCAMCPFGGAGEWLQRWSFFRRHSRALGLHLHWPEKWARWGLLPSVGMFLLLTWIEEFYNIAGPGNPVFTSLMVIGIISVAALTFLVFERRTFCRYLCPLSCLIGTAGATGMVAGFRTRDHQQCLTCPTKDCMRGSEHGYGCPWYEWPGSATSNLMCGLCTECVKNCPYDNIGLFVQAPMTSVVAPKHRRGDVAWASAILLGLVVFQQVNVLGWYAALDGWLNRTTHFGFGPYAYPNPVDYLGLIALVTGMVAVWAMGLRSATGSRLTAAPVRSPAVVPALSAAPSAAASTLDHAAPRPGSLAAIVVEQEEAEREASARPEVPWTVRFMSWFTPLAYGLIPLVASDYLARQLPKFWLHAPRIIAAISDPLGRGWNLFGTAHLAVANAHIIGSTAGIVGTQIGVVGIGTAAAVYTMIRIVRRDLVVQAVRPRLLTVLSVVSVLAAGGAICWLYLLMGGAQ